MEVKGTIKLVKDTQKISEKFSKREFVITTDDMYPQDILLQVTQDKCDMLNAYTPGTPVVAHFNLRGREWKNPQGEVKYFNTIECWRIEKGQSIGQSTPGKSSAPKPPENIGEDDGDMPF